MNSKMKHITRRTCAVRDVSHNAISLVGNHVTVHAMVLNYTQENRRPTFTFLCCGRQSVFHRYYDYSSVLYCTSPTIQPACDNPAVDASASAPPTVMWQH